MKFLVRKKILTVLLLLAFPALAGQFKAGVAKVDITPEIETPLAGYGARESAMSTGVMDRVYSRALVIDDGERKVALVSSDILLILEDLKDEIKKGVSDLELDGIMLSATHTHSGPGGYSDIWIVNVAVMGKYVPEYRKFLVSKISEAIRRADEDIRPAKFGADIFSAPGFAHNRRHPEPSAVVDPALGLIKITDISGKPIAYLINYAVHSTILPPSNLKISGDLAGLVERSIEEKDHSAVAFFFPGPLGDQGPNCEMKEDDFICLNRLGKGLSDKVWEYISEIDVSDEVRINVYKDRMKMPPSKLRRGCWVGLKWLMNKAGKRLIREEAEIMALKINDLFIYGVGAELAVEVGFHLKAQHPDKKVMIFAHSNDYLGYLLTPEEYDFGGYEACMSLYGKDFAPYLEEQYMELTKDTE